MYNKGAQHLNVVPRGRCRRPEALSVSSLVRQFEDVMTPAAGAERPPRRGSSAASLGGCSAAPPPPDEASQAKRCAPLCRRPGLQGAHWAP